MLQFLQPLWLWAATGIIIPVLIHLWKVKEGKVLTVGSVILLNAATEKSARSIQLNQLLLLLLRCLLIILFAMFLAGPRWVQKSSSIGKGWILISQNNGKAAYNQYSNLIDSLFNSGYIFKSWDTSLVSLKKEEVINSAKSEHLNHTISPWNMIDILNNKSPEGLPVFLFASLTKNQFAGKRPATNLSLQIFEFDDQSPAVSAVQHAHIINTDSVMITLGRSTSAINTIENKILAIDGVNADSVLFIRKNNLLYAHSGLTSTIKIDDETYAITIVAERGSYDAEAISAALKAIAQYSQYHFAIDIKTPSDNISATQKWIFWLSEKPVPTNISAEKYFIYAAGKPLQTSSVIITGKPFFSNRPLPLYQKIDIADPVVNAELVIWKDGFGKPLLVKHIDTAERYFFYSRFNAAWNGLVWDPVFPSILFDLLIGEQYHSFPAQFDQRKISNVQTAPAKITGSKKMEINRDALSLASFNWWIILLLFVVERLLSTTEKIKRID